MRKAILEEMKKALDPPIYVYQKTRTGWVCDKLTIHEDAKTWIRKRYILTAGTSCTCLGYIKFQKCKHLTMLSDDAEWPVTGVPKDYASQEAERLVQLVGPKFLKSVASWEVNSELVPEMVSVLTLNIVAEESPKEFERVAAIKKIAGVGTFGILLRIQPKN